MGGPVVRFLVVVGAPCFSAAITWSRPLEEHAYKHSPRVSNSEGPSLRSYSVSAIANHSQPMYSSPGQQGRHNGLSISAHKCHAHQLH